MQPEVLPEVDGFDAPEDANNEESNDSGSEYKENDDTSGSSSSDDVSACESEGSDCALEDASASLPPPSNTPSENPNGPEDDDVVEVPAPIGKKAKLVQGSLNLFVKKLPAPACAATCSGIPKDVQPVQPHSGRLALCSFC